MFRGKLWEKLLPILPLDETMLTVFVRGVNVYACLWLCIIL